MAIDYSILAIPKGRPRVASKLLKDRKADAAEKACYAKVDLRDGRRCQFPSCKKGIHQHHHIQYRSRGGQHVTSNVVSLCELHNKWVHGGLVTVTGNADKRLKWKPTRYGREVKIQVPQPLGDRAR